MNRYDQLLISENRNKLSFFLRPSEERYDSRSVDLYTTSSDANICEPVVSEGTYTEHILENSIDQPKSTKQTQKKKKNILEAVIAEDDLETSHDKPNSLTNSYFGTIVSNIITVEI